MDIRFLTADDAEAAAQVFLQSAEHQVEFDPEFYRVPSLEAVTTVLCS